MLRAIAVANHLAQRRTFSLDDARAALRGSGAQLRLWEELTLTLTLTLTVTLTLSLSLTLTLTLTLPGAQLRLWEELLASGAIPLVKVRTLPLPLTGRRALHGRARAAPQLPG